MRERADLEYTGTFFKKHMLLMLLIFTNIIFIALYWRFVLGQAVYMYADIGNDSFSSSYPTLSMISDMLHSGNISSINLTDGLGSDVTAILMQYLNPVKLIMVLFPHDLLPVGILLAVFIQVNLLSLFSWNFFRLLLSDRTFAFAPALIWTFSGYVILWGQNYSFLTDILLFTACMFFLQLYLQDDKKWKTIWLIPTLSLFLISGYYFLYMAGIFCILYTIGYLLLQKKGWKKILTKLIGLAVMAALSLLIGCAALLAILSTFSSSDRVGALSFSNILQDLIPKGGIIRYLTFLGRLFSVNIFGSGSTFQNYGNYFEAAILSTSILFFFADAYYLIQKKTRKKALIMNILSAVFLVFPVFSKILNFNPDSERWTFLLCFLEVIVIGFFIKDLLTDRNNYALKKSLIVTAVFTVLSLGLLLFLGIRKLVYIRKKTIVIIVAFLTAYGFFFLRLLKNTKVTKRAAFFFVCLLSLEMVLTNYATVNDRVYITQDQFNNSLYNDGSQDAIAKIKTSDTGLYRISNDRIRPADETAWLFPSDPELVYANEGLANGYASTNMYSSTIPRSLCTYTAAYKVDQITNNFFVINDFSEYYLYTLLCGKYRISQRSTSSYSDSDSSLFTISKDSTDDMKVFRNNNTLPFGYLYTNEISKSDFEAQNSAERMRAVTQGFFYTDTVRNENISFSSTALKESHSIASLSDCLSQTNDCSVTADGSSIKITASGNDAYAVFSIPDASAEEGKSLYLKITSDVPSDSKGIPMQIFMNSSDYQEFGTELESDVCFTSEDDTVFLPLPSGCSSVRLDILNSGSDPVVIKDAVFTDSVTTDFDDLKATDIFNISYSNDTYQATLTCDEDTGMLCVPISFNKNWTARVNGKTVQAENINGGLIGIPVEKGTSTIIMHYAIPHLLTACIISVISFLLFLAGFLFLKKKNR